jgi:putative transposase
VAYTAAQHDHPMLLRLTAARARHLAGEELRDGIDRIIQWKPSKDDRRAHPELPAEASVSGRLVVRHVQPSNGAEGFLLPLFTTVEGTPEEQTKLYGYRWNIETDLRTLKSTLQMEQLTCTTPEMVGKEIAASILAYNLIRAVIWLAAERAGLKPRQFSFTRTQNILRAFLPLIAAASPTFAGRADESGFKDVNDDERAGLSYMKEV